MPRLADCALELEGHDLDDMFETRAVALTALMVVAVTLCRTIGLEAAAIDSLLYDWLSELIFAVLGADPKAVTFHQFSLERAGTGWRARVVVDI